MGDICIVPFKFNAMWEVITTISEIDTVKPGTLLSKENPADDEPIVIYRVVEKADDTITITPDNNNINEQITFKSDTLFEEGWWMLKEGQKA